MKTTFRKLTLAWPLVIFLLLPTLSHGETAVQAWVQRYHGPIPGTYEYARALAVDGSNNVIVTGYSFGTNYDYAMIKYSSAGVPLWTNRYNGPDNGNDSPWAVVVDSGNNVIVTGWSGVFEDYLTIKYSSAGVPLWTNRYSGPGNQSDEAWAMAVDGSDNVIVTGYSTGNGGLEYYLTIKYSSAGVPLWTNSYNEAGDSSVFATAVRADSSNNVIVTGYCWGSSSRNDYATIKYSSAGVSLWTNRYNGPGNSHDYAQAVAVDGNNNVIVTGESYSIGSLWDFATIKYSSAGVPLWTNSYNGPGNPIDYAVDVAVDSSNDVVVTGWSGDTKSASSYVTIKYSSAGVPIWTNRYDGPGNLNAAHSVTVDRNNNVIVTGFSTNNVSGNDFLTIKYSSAGVPLWTNRYNGPGNGNETAVGLALDHSGNVIVAGYVDGGQSNRGFVTVKYICVPSPLMTGLQPTNGTFQLRVDDMLQPGTLVIEAATNLSTNWVPVFTNTTPTNVLFYTDPDAGNAPTRFYRAFQFP